MQHVLVTGGAGYIGSHMVRCLKQAGYRPVVLDNLSTGHRHMVSKDVLFVQGCLSDTQLLDELFSRYSFDAVMHFASFIQVGESVQLPIKYYQNNLANTLNLLSAMNQYKVKKLIFSSTAAVYGEPHYTPMNETHPVAPINPYGHSKSVVEQVLENISKAHELNYIALRYFNAAGADASGELCECHEPETHLIPLLLQVALGIRENINVFGTDYPTIDGTCVRDYIHVSDLCSAHLLALQMLDKTAQSRIYNLGTGEGYSVQQVIETVKRVVQQDIPVIYSARRAGDPAVLVADPTRAMNELGWRPMFSDLQTIVQHAWQAYGRQRAVNQHTQIVPS